MSSTHSAHAMKSSKHSLGSLQLGVTDAPHTPAVHTSAPSQKIPWKKRLRSHLIQIAYIGTVIVIGTAEIVHHYFGVFKLIEFARDPTTISP